MTGLDTNILVELLVSNKDEHEQTWKALNEMLNDHVGTTHVNIAETLRLITHPKVFSKPLKMSKAIEKVNELLVAENIEVLNHPEDWWNDVAEVSQTELPDMRGNNIFDAQIAIALKYNGVKRIWTKDSDFKKFSFLEVIRPLSSLKG